MRKYLYTDREVDLVRQLLDGQPVKIWSDLIQYVFDFGDYYIKLECVDKAADTQNEFDEAIIATLTKADKVFNPTADTKLIYKNAKVDNVFIVRTFLYFKTFREYSKVEKFVNRTTHKLKATWTGKNDPIEKLISETTGCGEEIICHPNSDEANKIDPNHSNLLDVGLLLEIDGQYLKAYIQSNGFGFYPSDDKYLFNTDDLKEDKEIYDFIKVESK